MNLLRRLSGSLFSSMQEENASEKANANIPEDEAKTASAETASGQEQVIVLSGQTELNAVAFDRARETTCVVSLKAPLLDDQKRVPVDMTLVVDRSGSMGSMMELVIESIEFIVLNLGSTDRLAIIDYDNVVSTTLPLTKMDEVGKQRAVSAAKSLTARGGTDLAGGLFEGMKTVQQRPMDKDANAVASVLLFTDGQANQGITDPNLIFAKMQDPDFIANYEPTTGSEFYGMRPRMSPMHRMRSPMSLSNATPRRSSRTNISRNRIQAPPPPSACQAPPLYQQQQQQQQQQQAPPPPPYGEPTLEKPNKPTKKVVANANANFTVNTFGFGANHNENLLKGIAEVGKGLYFFIENKEVLGDAFVDCIGGLLSVVGQDLKLSLSPSPGVELVDVNTFYPKQRNANGGMRLTIKDIQSEERRDLVCTVKLPKLKAPNASMEVVTATLEYDNVLTDTKETARTLVTLSRPAPNSAECKEASANPNIFVSEQSNRMVAAQRLKEAANLADKGAYKEAGKFLEEGMEIIKKSPASASPACQELLQSIQQSKSQMGNRTEYLSRGGKSARSKCSGYSNQRSNLQTPQFVNHKKSAMSKAFKSFKKAKRAE